MTEQELEAEINRLTNEKVALERKKAKYEAMNQKLNNSINNLIDASTKTKAASEAMNKNYVSMIVSQKHKDLAGLSTTINSQITLLRQAIEKSNYQIAVISNKIRVIKNEITNYREQLSRVQQMVE